MSRTAIIVLGVLAAALLAYIAVFERDSLSSKELQKRRGHLLEAFVRDRVSVLEIERDGRTLRLSREAADQGGFEPWRTVKPWRDEADIDAVDALLGELEWIDARRRIENVSEADLKSFGLKKPRIRLWFEAGRTRVLLEVGDRDVHGEGLYVRVDGGSSVAVVPKTLDEVLDHPLNHFRTKQFLGDITVAWARHVEIHVPDQDVTLTREGDRWWFEPAPRGFGDRRAMEQWLRSFDNLRAARYVPDAETEAARAALKDAPRRLLVKIIPDEGREDVETRILDMRVGDACPGHEGEKRVTVGEGGPVVCLRDDVLAPLLDDPEALRLRRPFAFDVSAIESLRFETGSDSIDLARDEDRWVTPDGEAGDVARLTVESWLADLADQRALAVEARQEGPAVSTLEVNLAEGGSYRLELGAPALQGRVVRRADEPAQLTFDARTADLLRYWPGRFRPLRLWELQPSQVVALEVRDDGGRARSLELRDGAWQVAGESEPAPDAARVREVVRTFAKMDAESIRAPRAAAGQGLSEPSLTLRATLDSGKQLELRVGSAAEAHDRRFAQLDGGVVVELAIENVSALRELVEPPAEAAAEPPAAETTKPVAPEEGEHGHGGHAH